MLHPAFYQKIGFLYALGNTPANNLAEQLLPGQDLRALLLGCGDPRHILFTSYVVDEPGIRCRDKFDYTCCDIEGAVIARNILLFSFIVDEAESKYTNIEIFDAFYHPYISSRVSQMIQEQTTKLLEAFSDIKSYQTSKYGKFIRISSQDTLSQLRAIWSLWAGVDKNAAWQKAIQRKLEQKWKKVNLHKKYMQGGSNFVMTGARSAGPACPKAINIVSEMHQHFWKHGTIHTVGTRELSEAKSPNVTFGFSSLGEDFPIHYGADPIFGFHLAPAFVPVQDGTISRAASKGASTGKSSSVRVVKVCQQQFEKWCTSFRSLVGHGRITIRCHIGDAISLCHKIQAASFDRKIHCPVKPWTFTACTLDGDVPPPIFNVIDLSNLVDHLGFYNIVLSVLPLLEKSPAATLFTETLLDYDHEKENGEQALATFLGCEPKMLFTILGIVPAPYICGYSSFGQIAEVLMNTFAEMSGEGRPAISQNFNRIPWKWLNYFDNSGNIKDNFFDADQKELARFLYAIYKKLFYGEDMPGMLANISLSKVTMAMNPHNTRATFVYVLGVIKSRLVPSLNWDNCMNDLLDLIMADRSMIVSSNFFQDLLTQAALMGVYEVDALKRPPHEVIASPLHLLSRRQRDPTETILPALTCVTFIVPRKSLKVLTDMPMEKIGTPVLQVNLVSDMGHNCFGAIRGGFGQVSPSVDQSIKSSALTYRTIRIDEDKYGWDGNADLVTSVIVPTWILLSQNLSNLDISLNLVTTPSTVQLISKLGMLFPVFTTKVDSKRVYFSKYFPGSETNLDVFIPKRPSKLPEDGRVVSVSIPGASEPGRLARRIPFSSKAEHETLKNKEIAVSHSKIGTRTAEVKVSTINKAIDFPYPIRGHNLKLRIARTSGYIDIVAEPSHPSDFTTEPLFPVFNLGSLIPYTFHRLSLDRLPILDTSSLTDKDWIPTSISISLSSLERKIRDLNMDKKSTGHSLIDLKDTIHHIVSRYLGIQPSKPYSIFSLIDEAQGGGYMLFFVSCLRIDLGGCQNIVLDVAVLPLEKSLLAEIQDPLSQFRKYDEIAPLSLSTREAKAWKSILPSLVERCRDWEHREECEYTKLGKIPLSAPDHPIGVSPICSCGKGKISSIKKDKWRGLEKYCTRIALGGLYSVPYATKMQDLAGAIAGAVDKDRCASCGKKEGKELKKCTGCKTIQYCSKECQKADWKEHKKVCKALAGSSGN